MSFDRNIFVNIGKSRVNIGYANTLFGEELCLEDWL